MVDEMSYIAIDRNIDIGSVLIGRLFWFQFPLFHLGGVGFVRCLFYKGDADFVFCT